MTLQNKKQQERINIRIDISLLVRLKNHCKKYGAVMSKVIRKAIENYLKSFEG